MPAERVLHWLNDFGNGEGIFGYTADRALHLGCKLAYGIVFTTGVLHP